MSSGMEHWHNEKIFGISSCCQGIWSYFKFKQNKIQGVYCTTSKIMPSEAKEW